MGAPLLEIIRLFHEQVNPYLLYRLRGLSRDFRQLCDQSYLFLLERDYPFPFTFLQASGALGSQSRDEIWTRTYTPSRFYLAFKLHPEDLACYHYQLALALEDRQYHHLRDLADRAFAQKPLGHLLLHLELNLAPNPKGLAQLLQRPDILRELSQMFFLPAWLLERAIELNQTESVQILLENGIKPTEQALILAARDHPDYLTLLLNHGGEITDQVFRAPLTRRVGEGQRQVFLTRRRTTVEVLILLLERVPTQGRPPDYLLEYLPASDYSILLPTLIRAYYQQEFRINTPSLLRLLDFLYQDARDHGLFTELRAWIVTLLDRGTMPSIQVAHLVALHRDDSLFQRLMGWRGSFDRALERRGNENSRTLERRGSSDRALERRGNENHGQASFSPPFLIAGQYLPQDLVLRLSAGIRRSILPPEDSDPASFFLPGQGERLFYHPSAFLRHHYEIPILGMVNLDLPCGLESSTGFLLAPFQDHGRKVTLFEGTQFEEGEILDLVLSRSWSVVSEILNQPHLVNDWTQYLAIIRFRKRYIEILQRLASTKIPLNPWLAELALTIGELLECLRLGLTPSTERIERILHGGSDSSGDLTQVGVRKEKKTLFRKLAECPNFTFTENLLELAVQTASSRVVGMILRRFGRPTERMIDWAIRGQRFKVLTLLLAHGGKLTQQTLEACLTATLNCHFRLIQGGYDEGVIPQLREIINLHLMEGFTLPYEVIETLPVHSIPGASSRSSSSPVHSIPGESSRSSSSHDQGLNHHGRRNQPRDLVDQFVRISEVRLIRKN